MNEFISDQFAVYTVLGGVVLFIIGFLAGRAKSTKPLYPNQIVSHIWLTVREKALSELLTDEGNGDEAKDLLHDARQFCNRVYNIDPKTLTH